ncbi:hypothetical protein ACT6NV_11180 [Robiginitalea sp. IMCC44478]|uniref:hypothetical protein n=1 Tax=Robiginitalea sp. IMCC44478 TaxID=3459122 RepID=UPI0040419DD7
MKKLIVRYSKRLQIISGIQALFFTTLGIVNIILEEYWFWLDYSWLLIGLAYVGGFLWYRFLPYASLESDTLTEHGFWKKSIDLRQLTTLKTFAWDLILQTPEQKLKLNLGIIHPGDKEKLMNALEAFAPEYLQGRAV